jgi:hypothetical protein
MLLSKLTGSRRIHCASNYLKNSILTAARCAAGSGVTGISPRLMATIACDAGTTTNPACVKCSSGAKTRLCGAWRMTMKEAQSASKYSRPECGPVPRSNELISYYKSSKLINKYAG